MNEKEKEVLYVYRFSSACDHACAISVPSVLEADVSLFSLGHSLIPFDLIILKHEHECDQVDSQLIQLLLSNCSVWP